MKWTKFELQHLAVPAVISLISFLAYGSQIWLFPYLDPGDLTGKQKGWFNFLVGCIWVGYWRAVRCDPGRVIGGPVGGNVDGDNSIDSNDDADGEINGEVSNVDGKVITPRPRWCRKCQRHKPPRAHHCKVCQRCIPKMDHHCPWTANCVSHFTLPHFMRFLFYATMAMIQLQYFYILRVMDLWENRALPSYLGPSHKMLGVLVLHLIINTLTLFSVGIMFIRTLYDVSINTTTIESWEISRHNQLLRRARALGGFLYGPDGQKVPIRHQEFPYDIGIWANWCQAMASANPLSWLWVFSRGRRAGGDEGMVWETNGFEDESVGWPPVDPDRIPRSRPWGTSAEGAFTYEAKYGYGEMSPREELEAFKQRQQADIERRNQKDLDSTKQESGIRRRKRFHERFDEKTHELLADDYDDDSKHERDDHSESGEEGWKDENGSRLKDYGVDEDVEFYDEDDVPLAELVRRRRIRQQQQQKQRQPANTT